MKQKTCNTCVMDITDNAITFDEEGRCEYCLRAEKILSSNYFPNAKGKQKLESIISKIKEDCRNDEYDCLVGVSGGLDSSYVIYLGYQYGLRMLAVHIDDGLDTELAKQNIANLCNKAQVKIITIKPDLDQYKDLVFSFFKASVPNLTIPQDNILLKSLNDVAIKYKFKYYLSGGNFAHESILQQIQGNAVTDITHIKAIHKQFGKGRINKLRLLSNLEQYLNSTYFSKITYVRPLNFIDYNMNSCINALEDFCGYKYYGGKHYENILTRFLQCWYLPIKYNYDKRKSHFSSLIVSGQMSREDALNQLTKKPYINDELKEYDFNFLANYFGISRAEFNAIIELEPKQHTDYKTSRIFKLSKFGIKIKKIIKKKSVM